MHAVLYKGIMFGCVVLYVYCSKNKTQFVVAYLQPDFEQSWLYKLTLVIQYLCKIKVLTVKPT